MEQVPGEAAIPQQTQQQVSPDIQSQQGQSQLFQKAIAANLAKQIFDKVFGSIAKSHGWDFSSRVKDIETASAKIAQKRLQGRDYGIEDINDMAGFRLIVPKESEISKAKDAVKNLEKDGLISINKNEWVKQGTYKGYHIDFTTPTGIDAELQIHTPKTELEGVANHDLRAIHGEEPPEVIKNLQRKQADIIEDLPNKKASQLSDALQSLHKQNNNKPIPPQITASMLQSMGR